jgi:hypothetical protein
MFPLLPLEASEGGQAGIVIHLWLLDIPGEQERITKVLRCFLVRGVEIIPITDVREQPTQMVLSVPTKISHLLGRGLPGVERSILWWCCLERSLPRRSAPAQLIKEIQQHRDMRWTLLL